MLERFKAVPVSITESAPGGAGGRLADGLGVSVKYLSSSRLLGLQLRDATMRRHFLLQVAAGGAGRGGAGAAALRSTGRPVPKRGRAGACRLQRQASGALPARSGACSFTCASRAALRRATQCLILMHWCEKPSQKETPGALKGLRGKPLEDLHALQRQVRRLEILHCILLFLATP